jgi:hypothetical protein
MKFILYLYLCVQENCTDMKTEFDTLRECKERGDEVFQVLEKNKEITKWKMYCHS